MRPFVDFIAKEDIPLWEMVLQHVAVQQSKDKRKLVKQDLDDDDMDVVPALNKECTILKQEVPLSKPSSSSASTKIEMVAKAKKEPKAAKAKAAKQTSRDKVLSFFKKR